jgi:hypothetical protein
MKKKYIVANFEARSVALFAAMVFTGPLGFAQRAPATGGSQGVALSAPAVARAALQRSMQPLPAKGAETA